MYSMNKILLKPILIAQCYSYPKIVKVQIKRNFWIFVMFNVG